MRAPVSVICPFVGSDEELETTVAALSALRLGNDDEILLADNRPAAKAGVRGQVRILPASGPASSYFARAVAAARAGGEWLVFIDADAAPDPGLLDAYFDPAPGPRVAVLAGGVEDWVAEDSTVARYIAARRKLDQRVTLGHPSRPYAQTVNCAVRRTAFEAVGGFPDPVRSGGDADLCWRLAAAGWEIEQRSAARVRHRNRASLGALLRQIHRHGSGMEWLERRYPGAFARPRPRELAGRFALLVRRRPGSGPFAFAALDFLTLWARDLGRLKANGDPTRP